MASLLRVLTLAGAILAAAAAAGSATAQTKVTFGTDWLAEAEHGGFYQALALGLYKKHGLDVTIRMGGPQNNPPQQIAAGIVDFQMSSGSSGPLSLAEQDIPVVALAAYFQKDPQVLIAHPGMGNDTLAAMKGKPVMVSAAARNGYWLFLRAKYGFTDDMIRPYTYSVAPFLADRTSIQQGFVSSEPYQIERMGNIKPVITLLADNGYSSYSNLVLAQSKTVRERPEVVRAFIEASTEGWYSYLYGDPTPGNELIRRDNKDMTQDVIDNAIRVMKQYGIVDSGDASSLGIGAMTDARWQDFFQTMVGAGLYPAGMDYHKAYTLQFVSKKYGLELKR